MRYTEEQGAFLTKLAKAKFRAQGAVAKAIKTGALKRADKCEQCGRLDDPKPWGKLHAHHDDYSKLLTVRWLCSKCHNRWHILHGSWTDCFRVTFGMPVRPWVREFINTFENIS